MTTTDVIDVKLLRKTYAENPVAKLALDYFAARQKNSNSTPVDRLLDVLRQNGVGAASRGDIIELFRTLAKAKCGQFLVGRKGFPSRFQWSVALISVGQAAAGETNKVEALSESDAKSIAEEEAEVESIEHRFRLRPTVEVRVDLPADLTTTEAARIADFVKTLPFSK